MYSIGVISLKIVRHQWFWSYEISDFNSCQKKAQNLKYVCYMMVLDGLPKSKQGYFRLLETSKRVIHPTNIPVYLLAKPIFSPEYVRAVHILGKTGLFIIKDCL
jgi:Cytochrome C oxidase subunit II, periplasmic domain